MGMFAAYYMKKLRGRDEVVKSGNITADSQLFDKVIINVLKKQVALNVKRLYDLIKGNLAIATYSISSDKVAMKLL